MGDHRTDDNHDPLRPHTQWWMTERERATAEPASHRRVDDRTTHLRTLSGPPPGMPTDRYGEQRPSTHLSRGRATVPAPQPIRSEGMPTQDTPRPPRQVSAPPRRPTPAERPSLGVRALDAARTYGRDAVYSVLAVAVAFVVGMWAADMDRAVNRLQQENQQLRVTQIDQQKRLNTAETEVEEARSESSDAKNDADQLRQRVTQLEEDTTPTSGS